jgi:hypothetical protein
MQAAATKVTEVMCHALLKKVQLRKAVLKADGAEFEIKFGHHLSSRAQRGILVFAGGAETHDESETRIPRCARDDNALSRRLIQQERWLRGQTSPSAAPCMTSRRIPGIHTSPPRERMQHSQAR